MPVKSWVRCFSYLFFQAAFLILNTQTSKSSLNLESSRASPWGHPALLSTLCGAARQQKDPVSVAMAASNLLLHMAGVAAAALV